jgi:hypothetical protein
LRLRFGVKVCPPGSSSIGVTLRSSVAETRFAGENSEDNWALAGVWGGVYWFTGNSKEREYSVSLIS